MRGTRVLPKITRHRVLPATENLVEASVACLTAIAEAGEQGCAHSTLDAYDLEHLLHLSMAQRNRKGKIVLTRYGSSYLARQPRAN